MDESESRPILCRIVDRDKALAPIPQGLASAAGRPYSCGRFTVRVEGRPVATATFGIPHDGLGVEGLAAILDEAIARATPISGQREAIPPECRPMVSVVIATKDRDVELRRCLPRLLGSSYPDFEVLVMDNGPSTERTADLVASLADPRVRYFRLPIPGVSRARNRGVEEANGSIIAFTDDDVEVDASWISEIVRAFCETPAADAVTGLVLPAALETRAQLIFEEMGGFDRGFQPRVFTRHSNPTESTMYPFALGTYGSGNNMALRREAVRRLGGFDEALGPGTPARAGEDVYLLLDVLLSGGAIAYQPSAIVRHYHRCDPEELLDQLTGYGAGLTAVYTKCLLRDPRTAMSFLSRVPAGLKHLGMNALSPFAGHTDHSASPALRARMVSAERRGMLMGPWWYFISRHSVSRTRHRAGRPVRSPTDASALPEPRLPTDQAQIPLGGRATETGHRSVPSDAPTNPDTRRAP